MKASNIRFTSIAASILLAIATLPALAADNSAKFAEAERLFRSHNLAEALVAADQAEDLNSDDYRVQVLKAYIYLGLGRLKYADHAAQRARFICPGDQKPAMDKVVEDIRARIAKAGPDVDEEAYDEKTESGSIQE